MIDSKLYTCYSGAADGSDTKRESMSKEYGCNVKSFSFGSHKKK